MPNIFFHIQKNKERKKEKKGVRWLSFEKSNRRNREAWLSQRRQQSKSGGGNPFTAHMAGS